MNDDEFYYADTDFLLALLKPEDWLKENAEKLYEKYQGKIFTSETGITEIMLCCKKYDLDVMNYVTSVCSFVEIINGKKEFYVQAAYFMKEFGLTTFDSIHAAYSKMKDLPIISSERKYDELGINKIQLK